MSPRVEVRPGKYTQWVNSYQEAKAKVVVIHRLLIVVNIEGLATRRRYNPTFNSRIWIITVTLILWLIIHHFANATSKKTSHFSEVFPSVFKIHLKTWIMKIWRHLPFPLDICSMFTRICKPLKISVILCARKLVNRKDNRASPYICHHRLYCTVYSVHSAKNNLNLRFKTEPFTFGAHATVKIMYCTSTGLVIKNQT